MQMDLSEAARYIKECIEAHAEEDEVLVEDVKKTDVLNHEFLTMRDMATAGRKIFLITVEEI